ncbi:hypothetical protein L1887_19953 [Cichorium endivia]|nr:hypothetical protein L1887_19953 [Cichorium endivia]
MLPFALFPAVTFSRSCFLSIRHLLSASPFRHLFIYSPSATSCLHHMMEMITLTSLIFSQIPSSLDYVLSFSHSRFEPASHGLCLAAQSVSIQLKTKASNLPLPASGLRTMQHRSLLFSTTLPSMGSEAR